MIDRFDGNYEFLSNFAEYPILYQGQLWPSNEHAFQGAKTLDPIQKNAIRYAYTPGQAKRLGRQVTLRPDWEEVKKQIMYEICYEKFTQHEDLAKALLETGEQKLVEGNYWHDCYWGVCNGVGDNHLGKILMRIREELRGTDKESADRA